MNPTLFSRLLTCAMFFVAGLVQAQVSITTTGTPYTENFDGIGNSATATVPNGWRIDGTAASTNNDWATLSTATTVVYGTTGANAVTGSSAAGAVNWANGVTASSTDRSIGYLNSGTFISGKTVAFRFTNNTGSTITDLTIAFDYEKYRAGTRAYGWTFFHGAGTAATTAATAGDQAYGVDGANAPVNPPTTVSKSFGLSGLSIANGTSYTLRWVLTGVSGHTNAQGFGIDNFSITAGGAPPAVINSNITFGATTTTSVVVNLTGGNGTGRILVVKQASAVTFTPTNGNNPAGANSDFTLGADLGGANILVYNASGTSVTVTGLQPSTVYHFATWDYDGTVTYSASAGTANMTTPGPILYSGGTYNQDFNSLPATGPITVTGTGPYYTSTSPVNATGTQGWQYQTIAGANALFTVSDGSSTAGSLYSFGTGSNTDRALGAIASGSLIGQFGAIIRNTGATPLTSFTISYTGEQWRDGGSNTPNQLSFSYSLNGTDISTGTYSAVPALAFTSPISSAVPSALNGNSGVNQAAISSIVSLSSNWMPGTDLIIKWSDANDSGNDDGLGIDGFSFSASSPTTPTVQDNTISFSSVLTTSMTVDWVNGDGAGHVVILNTSNSFTDPVDGTDPTANSVYAGSGEQVVYNGTGSSVNVTGLTPGTTYWARVYGYNGFGASTLFITSTATDNPNSQQTAVPTPPTQLVVLNVNNGNDVIQGTPFSILVEAQDNANAPQVVSQNTTVTLTVFTGSGALAGTVSGIMIANTSQVLISGITYDTPETGVELEAASTAGDVLASGLTPPFTVLGVATTLSFTGVPANGLVNTPISTFQVQALRDDFTVDTYFTGAITVSVLSGPGNISGTLTVNAVNGVAPFTDIEFDAPGSYIMKAQATGLSDGASTSVAITLAPTMTELVVPRYIGSKSTASANANRTPFAVCLQFDNLVPSTPYDIRTGVALTSDAATSFGAGNIWNGTVYGTTNLNNYFTTDGSGSSGPVWIYIQPTGNATRFDAGQVHNMRVSVAINANPMPANPMFVGTKTITALDIASTARTVSTADDGAYVQGISGACVTGKHILVFDNVSGTGDPLFSFQAITTTPSDATAGNYSGHPVSIRDIYQQNGTSNIGDYPAVVPIGANNANGVRRIEARNTDNTFWSAITDADGIWPGGANFTTITRRSVGTIGASDPLLAVDGDGDATPDCLDGCPTDPNKTAPGVCGCNVADTPATYYADADNDGLGDPATPVPGFTCVTPPGAVANSDDPCPSIMNGTPGDACDDGNPNTFNDVLGASPSCSCAGTACTLNLTLEFQLDGVSTENWEIRAQGTNTLIQSGSAFLPLVGNFSVNTCVPNGCFYLKVTDDGGDGITGGGYILRTTSPSKRIIDNRNNFTSGAVSQIAGNQGWCVTSGAIGNDRLVTASCDRFDLQRGATSACSEKLTADNTPNGTSGNVYQFWVYNPNGPESQLIPATGAGSNILSMNQITLPAGKLYNIKVRTRISPGVYRDWGAACRMSISTTTTPCRTTKLVDDVSSPNWSCGKTVTLPAVGGGNGAQNMLVAKPATRLNANCVEVGANKYQFRIKDVDTQISTVISGVGSNYYCYITQPTFGPCKQYEVDVRVSFDNGATWCNYSDVCTVYTGGCLWSGGEHMGAGGAAMHLYPNPNRGDQIALRLEGFGEVSTVSVDIYDAFGKRVIARTIAAQDGFVNQPLELNGTLAAGLYVVNITAGEAIYTERLVIQP